MKSVRKRQSGRSSNPLYVHHCPHNTGRPAIGAGDATKLMTHTGEEVALVLTSPLTRTSACRPNARTRTGTIEATPRQLRQPTSERGRPRSTVSRGTDWIVSTAKASTHTGD